MRAIKRASLVSSVWAMIYCSLPCCMLFSVISDCVIWRVYYRCRYLIFKYFSRSPHNVNSLWPGDAIWWHRSVSTKAQVMAWCHQAPSHYLNQFWLFFKCVLQHSTENNFTVSTKVNIVYNEFEKYVFKITAMSPKGQWVKLHTHIC